MNQREFETKMKAFLKRTGEDFKRMGKDIQVEAKRLADELNDPDTKQKMKRGLDNAGDWAKRTADEIAEVLTQGAKKAESAWNTAGDRVRDFGGQPVGTTASSPGAKAEVGQPAAAAAPQAAAKKSVGKAPAKKAGTKKKSGARKTLGRKKGPPTGA